MKAYNIYSNGIKVNTKPLSIDAISKIFKAGAFSVKTGENSYKQYNTKNIKIIECTVV